MIKSMTHADSDASGERLMILKMIEISTKDAMGQNGRQHIAGARKYLASARHRSHLESLDLPAEWIPKAIEEKI